MDIEDSVSSQIEQALSVRVEHVILPRRIMEKLCGVKCALCFGGCVFVCGKVRISCSCSCGRKTHLLEHIRVQTEELSNNMSTLN